MNPVIVEIGPFSLTWYGVFIVAAQLRLPVGRLAAPAEDLTMPGTCWLGLCS